MCIRDRFAPITPTIPPGGSLKERLSISNLSSKTQNVKLNSKFNKYRNLLNPENNLLLNKEMKLGPFQTVWLSNQ